MEIDYYGFLSYVFNRDRVADLFWISLRKMLTDASTQETADSVGARIDDPLPSSSTCDTGTQCNLKPPGMSHGKSWVFLG